MQSSTGYIVQIVLPPAPEGVNFRHLRQAVREAGELQQQKWLQLAAGEVVNRLTGAYITGLRTAESMQYPFDGDKLAVGVFNVAKHAAAVEYGTEAFDLAKRIRWGSTPKSRLGKQGWYIRIPFRHYTPAKAGEGASVGREKASMPAAVYNLASKLDRGERLTGNRGRIVSTFGAQPPAGVRGIGAGKPLKPGQHGPVQHGRYIASLRPDVAETIGKPRAKSGESFAAAVAHAKATGGTAPGMFHAAGRYEGMFKSGAQNHTQYMTVRTITQRSSWWIPARRGAFAAQKVAEQTDPIIRAMLEDAFRRDIEAAIGGALGAA